jgi:hypothetical protein
MDAGTIGGSDWQGIAVLVLSTLFGISQIASRLAQKIGGKSAVETTGKIELIFREVLDFLAGNHGKPGDPTAIKPE